MTHTREIEIAKEDYYPSLEVAGRPSVTLLPVGDGTSYKLTGKPLRKFLQYQGHTLKSVVGPCREAKSALPGMKVLEAAYAASPTQGYKLLMAGKDVVRFTTDEFVAIPDSMVKRVIDNRLKAEGVAVRRYSHRFGVHIYDLAAVGAMDPKVGDICYQIRARNANTGNHAFKMSGGACVLACTNGMVSPRNMTSVRIPHLFDAKAIKRAIEEQLGRIMEKLPEMPAEFMALKRMKVTKEEARRRVWLMPMYRYEKRAIWDRLFFTERTTGKRDWDGTMWGVYMAATYVASHSAEVPKGRHAKEVDTAMMERLSDVSSFTLDWDKREKELEKAKKLIPIPVAF